MTAVKTRKTSGWTTNHTPKPWGFEDRDNPHMVTAGKDRKGCWRYICDPSYIGNKGKERANSNLIIAAPELLEACKAVEKSQCVGAFCGDRSKGKTCIHAIVRFAIAKAEGRVVESRI
jgi:hypothetical protein